MTPTDWSVVSYSLRPRSPPGSSVHEILQGRILEWVAIPFSRRASWPRDQIQVSCIAGRFFTTWASREAQGLITISHSEDCAQVNHRPFGPHALILPLKLLWWNPSWGSGFGGHKSPVLLAWPYNKPLSAPHSGVSVCLASLCWTQEHSSITSSVRKLSVNCAVHTPISWRMRFISIIFKSFIDWKNH